MSLMNIILKFDIESYCLYIPDGFVSDIKLLQSGFFEWIENQPICGPSRGPKDAVCFGAVNFLQYINDVVLSDTHERAYFVAKCAQKRIPTLVF